MSESSYSNLLNHGKSQTSQIQVATSSSHSVLESSKMGGVSRALPELSQSIKSRHPQNIDESVQENLRRPSRMISSILKNRSLSKRSIGKEVIDQDSFKSDVESDTDQNDTTKRKARRQPVKLSRKRELTEEDKFPHLKMENKSLFEGVETYLLQKYAETKRAKPLNFTSRKYKKYVKGLQVTNKEGYQRLKEAIHTSYQTVKKVKMGISLGEQQQFQQSLQQSSLPILENVKIREDLNDFLDHQVSTYSNFGSISPLKKTSQSQSVMHQTERDLNFSNAFVSQMDYGQQLSNQKAILKGQRSTTIDSYQIPIFSKGSQLNSLTPFNEKDSSFQLLNQYQQLPHDRTNLSQYQTLVHQRQGSMQPQSSVYQQRIQNQSSDNISNSNLHIRKNKSSNFVQTIGKIQSQRQMQSISSRNISTISQNPNFSNHPKNQYSLISDSQPPQSVNESDYEDPEVRLERLRQKFSFPLNPAFFHSSVSSKAPRKLLSLETYCLQNNIQLTKQQSVQSTLTRVQKEHKFWQDKLQTIVKGYSEDKLNEMIVNFINDIDFNNLSQAEMELIFGKEIAKTEIGRLVRSHIQKFLDQRKKSQRDESLSKSKLRNQIEHSKNRSIDKKRDRSGLNSSFNVAGQSVSGQSLANSQFRNTTTQKLVNQVSFPSYSMLHQTLISNNNFDMTKIDKPLEELEAQAKSGKRDGKMSHKEKAQQYKLKQSFKMKRPLQKQGSMDMQDSDDSSSDGKLGINGMQSDDNYQLSTIIKGQGRNPDSQGSSFKQPAHFRNQLKNQQQRSKNQLQQLEQLRKKTILKEHKSKIKAIHSQLQLLTQQIEKLELEESKGKQKEFKSIKEKKETQAKEDMMALRKYLKICFHKRNIEIAKLLNTTDRIQSNNQVMSEKLLRMLDRVDIDRPLLFKEKLQALWRGDAWTKEKRQMSPEVMQRIYGSKVMDDTKLAQLKQKQLLLKQDDDESNQSSRNLRQLLENRKLERMKLNTIQKEVYKKMLHLVATRRKNENDQDIQPEEIRILELMKIILDGGWVIDEQVFEVMFNISGIEDLFDLYMIQVGDTHLEDLARQQSKESDEKAGIQNEASIDELIQMQLDNKNDEVDQRVLAVLKTSETLAELLQLEGYQFLIPRHRKMMQAKQR